MKLSASHRLRKFKKIVKKESQKLQNNSLVGEFKSFIMRGSVLDLAVGVIIGGAFQKIVTSIVGDVFMPIVSLITKLINQQGIDFSNWFISLDGNHYETLKAAKEAEAIIIHYGNLLTNGLDFIIMAIVIFLLVKGINRLSGKGKKQESSAAPEPERQCPFCMTAIHRQATRCPHCTSLLEELSASEPGQGNVNNEKGDIQE